MKFQLPNLSPLHLLPITVKAIELFSAKKSFLTTRKASNTDYREHLGIVFC
jgi:hypothetical protein